MKKQFLALLLGASTVACAQAPQIPVTGNIGPGGLFAFRNANPVSMTDANLTLSYPATSAGFVKVTSSVSLTAQRNVIEPFLANAQCFENLTTGSQSIQIIGSSGTGVVIANGNYACVQGDGTNYVTSSGGGGGGAVSSVFGRTGTVSAQSGDYTVSQVTGAAPLASPALTGTPTAPTATTGTNTNQVATTAFVLANAGSGAVSSVSNSDGTLTVSPTTGSVVASLNLAHANTWTAVQTAPGYQTSGSVNGAYGFTSVGTLPSLPTGNTVQITVPNSGITAYELELPPVQPSGSNTFLSCTAANPAVCSWAAGGGGGGSGTVTSFAAPSGSWPTWLVPAVTNSTTTPSLAVAASAIPNSALANSSIPINGTTCTLGTTCTVTLPETSYIFYPVAVCSGGVSFPAGLTTYDNNQPSPGCTIPASSTSAFLAFNQTPTNPQYAEATVTLPPFWTATSITFFWYTTVTTGNVVWEVQTACPATGSAVGSPTFNTALTVTSTAPGTAGTLQTASISNIGTAGVNGCPNASSSPGVMVYRIFRAASDTAAANANLTGVTLAVARSQ